MSAPIRLKRELGFIGVTLSGVGIILGAGIYVLIGEAAALSGNALWLSFAFAAFIAAFTGLSYAELSSMLPYAGAEYDYTAKAFNHRLAFIIGSTVILSSIVGASSVALGFAGYFSTFSELPILAVAATLIVGLSLLTARGIKESAIIAIIFTLIETGGLIGIIAIGLPHFGHVNYFEMPTGLSGIFSAAALIFFAFIGFEEIVKLSEEARSPERTIPQGLILALVIAIILYILVAIAAVSAVGWERLAASPAPFVEIAMGTLGTNAALVFICIALFATANTSLLLLISASRITYGMAKSGSLPKYLASVHVTRQTPILAIFIVMVFSLGFLLLGDISLVASVTNFTEFITFIVINAAVIALRYRSPDIPRPFRAPLNPRGIPLVPVCGIIFCLFFLTQLTSLTLGIGLFLLIVIGFFSFLRDNKSAGI